MNLIKPCLAGVSLSFDATHGAAKKATIVNAQKKRIVVAKGGVVTFINEDGQVIAWVSCVSHTLNQASNL